MDIEAHPFREALPDAGCTDPFLLPGGAEAWSLSLPGGHEVVLLRSGIGLVAAASALATALTQVRPEVVVSAGTAGGLGRAVEVGDVCVSTTLAFTDADATAFGYAPGQIPGQPAVFEGDAALLDRLTESGESVLHAVAAVPTVTSGPSARPNLTTRPSAVTTPDPAATPSAVATRIHAGQMLSGNSFVTAANVADARERFPEALSTDMESTALAQVCAAFGIPFVSVRGISDLCGPEAGQDFHIAAEEAAARSTAVTLALLA